jgi:hypothetical protein
MQHVTLFMTASDPDWRLEEVAMRTLRGLAWAAIVTVVPVAGGSAAEAATVVGGPQGRVVAPAPSSATVMRLSRLHHLAARQVQLGRLAQLSAHRSETRAYGGRLVNDFQALGRRISAAAAELGIDPAMLEATYAGENTAALAREAEDLTRLGAASGDDLDRQFWMVLAQDQLAATDLLLPIAGADPRLEPLVADLGRQLDTSSRGALLAAAPVAVPPNESVPAASVMSPTVPPAPVTTPGPVNGRY